MEQADDLKKIVDSEYTERGVAVCKECGRKFDLMDENDVSEWYYGHDCEA